MMVKKTRLSQQILRSRLNDKYFNYDKKSYYAKVCLGCINSKKKSKDKKIELEVKRIRWKKNQILTNRIATTMINSIDKELNGNFHPIKRAVMI